MMLGISMRMSRCDYPNGNFELRNAISCDWPAFLEAALPGVPYVFLPNTGRKITAYAQRMGVTALLLSGGEDWGLFAERDETEESLFAWAMAKAYPVLGVCRGAQVINRLLGGRLSPCANHAACRHKIVFRDNFRTGPPDIEVNSFHKHCIGALAHCLADFAMAEDGSVEGFYNQDKKILGIMWHPEREKIPAATDLTLMRNFYLSNAP